MELCYAGPLASYNSLQDEHLANFHSQPRLLKHLHKMQLITDEEEIVDEATIRRKGALKQGKISAQSNLDETESHTTAQSRKIKRRIQPSPYLSKSFCMPPHPTTKPKSFHKRSKTLPCVGTVGVTQNRSQVRVTLRYEGESVKLLEENDTVEVVIEQQHCWGDTVCVYKGNVRPKSCLTFTSWRHIGCPFGITIYLDSKVDFRLSTCCEYKHQPCAGKILGSHFSIMKIEGDAACCKCDGVADQVIPTLSSKETTSEVALQSPSTQVSKHVKSENQVKSGQDTHGSSGDSEARNEVGSSPPKDSDDQHEPINTTDSNKIFLPSHDQDASSGQGNSVKHLPKRRSVMFSPDTKELDTDKTIKEAKETLKKSLSGLSFSSVLSSDSDKNESDILSSSSSVSQPESTGLIIDHNDDDKKAEEIKGNQEENEESEDERCQSVADQVIPSKKSTGKVLLTQVKVSDTESKDDETFKSEAKYQDSSDQDAHEFGGGKSFLNYTTELVARNHIEDQNSSELSLTESESSIDDKYDQSTNQCTDDLKANMQFADDVDDLQSRESKTIKAILEDNNIEIQNEDRKKLKYFMVQVEGLFRCSKCSGQWSSHRTTIVVNLYHKRIQKKYKQKCKRCMIWITPYFTEDRLKKIMKKVIKKYQKRKTKDSLEFINDDDDDDDDDDEIKGYSSAPHETELCERCQELGKPCWQY